MAETVDRTSTLLVVDDEPNVRHSLQKALRSDTVNVVAVGTAKEGIDRVRQQPVDAVLLDVRLPDMSGLDAYLRLREIDPRLPVIIITAHATTETAIEAIKRGAFEYLLKPVELRQLRDVVGRAIRLSHLNRTPQEQPEPQPAPPAEDDFVGRSAAMQALYKSIGRVAPQDVTVLIQGESGVGKELVARAIFRHSRRSHGPLLAINCAAIPESLLESELFGHEKGAFTGADRRRIGKFEQADGGTIFMDEVGDMSLATQSKLLRLLQEQQFERVGGNETIRTDVRLIAATNQGLGDMVSGGRFRQDLYYRLNVFTIPVPPLRERPDDLALLVQHFLAQYNSSLQRRVRGVSDEAMRLLKQHSWPGNVRELQSTIKYAIVHAVGEIITPDTLPDPLRSLAAQRGSCQPGNTAGAIDVAGRVRALLSANETDIYHKVHATVDRVILEEVLRYAKGNQVEAAQILGLSRNTLRVRLHVLGLSVEKQVTQELDRDGP